eukprot:Nitzschia sp. Nitz4//scaffold230_size58257//30525//32174//NITZ4_006483-RA/size58257-processed-gene-0.65-mRNA-1//-1//CDS//3329543256//7734//frame0
MEVSKDSCCGNDGGVNPPWVDWVESGVEFFGCDPSLPGRDLLGRAMMMRKDAPVEKSVAPEFDFARLHEEFFESLLTEQVKLNSALDHPIPFQSSPSRNSTSSSQLSVATAASTASPLAPLDVSHSRDDSIGTTCSTLSSCTFQSNPAKSHRRRRPLRLPSRKPKHTRVAPIEAYDLKYNPAHQAVPLSSDNVSLAQLLKDDLPQPIYYMHHTCALQKDKGKGDALGSSISARGSTGCLEKLREKMAIVVQVSSKEKAGIKKRPAKIAARTLQFVETRSIIELRVGFLSMQYGLLLRWDVPSNKIVFMVLRKMCHDSFYTSIQEPKALSRPLAIAPPPLVVKSDFGSHAIYPRVFGTEVYLVDPPYKVPQPQFLPNNLQVHVQPIHSLPKRQRWTLSLSFNGHTDLIHLHHNPSEKQWEIRRAPVSWELSPNTSFDMSTLEIRLLQQEKRKHSTSKLIGTVSIPLGGLVVQPTSAPVTQWEVTVPLAETQLTLTINYQSDYAHWLFQELEARKGEVYSSHEWEDGINQQPFLEDPIDWFCGLCFKEIYL